MCKNLSYPNEGNLNLPIPFIQKRFCFVKGSLAYFFDPANAELGALFGYAELLLPEKLRTSGFSKSLKNRAKVQGDSFLRVTITGVSNSSSTSMNGSNQWTLDSVRVRFKLKG